MPCRWRRLDRIKQLRVPPFRPSFPRRILHSRVEYRRRLLLPRPRHPLRRRPHRPGNRRYLERWRALRLPNSKEPRAQFTLTIQGAAGSGRSVIGGMLRRRLEGKPACRSTEPHITLWFDASLPRSSPTLTTSLMRALALALDRERPSVQRHLHRLPLGLQTPVAYWKSMVKITLSLLTILLVAGGFALMTPGLPPDLVSMRKDMLQILDQSMLGNGLVWVGAFGVAAALATALELFGFLFPHGRKLASYVRDKHSAEEPKARAELGALLRAGVPAGCRMVVFIENLEKAGVLRSAELLDSLKTTLKFPEVVFVLLTDAQALRKQSEEDSQAVRGGRSARLAGVANLQVDLPGWAVARPDTASSRSKGSKVGHARGFAAFWGPWSRDWRGDRRIEEVMQRTMFV